MAKRYLRIAAVALGFICASFPAYAQLVCSGGAPQSGTSLFNYTSSGTGNNFDACEYTGVNHIFSQIVCDFVSMLDTVLDQVYCSMQTPLTAMVSVVLTLYLMVFGMQLLMGISQLNARDVLMRLFKIGAVWMFVANSSWGINYIFTFFVSVLTETSMWVLNAFNGANANDSGFWTVNQSASDPMQLFGFLDTFAYNLIISPFTQANAKVIGLFAAMMAALPPVFMMAVYWLGSTVALLVRSMMIFLLCLTGIALLVTLSPIFLCFMLFQPTANFFESGVRHLTSFSLQVAMDFGIILIWMLLTSQFVNFFNGVAPDGTSIGLENVIFGYDNTVAEADKATPKVTSGLCPYTVDYSSFPPQIQCQSPYNVSGPCPGTAGCFDPITNKTDEKKEVALPDFVNDPALIGYFFWNLFPMTLIGFAVNSALKQAPMVARTIVGPDQAVGLLPPGWTGVVPGRNGLSFSTQTPFGQYAQKFIRGSGSGRIAELMGGTGAAQAHTKNMQGMVTKRNFFGDLKNSVNAAGGINAAGIAGKAGAGGMGQRGNNRPIGGAAAGGGMPSYPASPGNRAPNSPNRGNGFHSVGLGPRGNPANNALARGGNTKAPKPSGVNVKSLLSAAASNAGRDAVNKKRADALSGVASAAGSAAPMGVGMVAASFNPAGMRGRKPIDTAHMMSIKKQSEALSGIDPKTHKPAGTGHMAEASKLFKGGDTSHMASIQKQGEALAGDDPVTHKPVGTGHMAAASKMFKGSDIDHMAGIQKQGEALAGDDPVTHKPVGTGHMTDIASQHLPVASETFAAGEGIENMADARKTANQLAGFDPKTGKPIGETPGALPAVAALYSGDATQGSAAANAPGQRGQQAAGSSSNAMASVPVDPPAPGTAGTTKQGSAPRNAPNFDGFDRPDTVDWAGNTINQPPSPEALQKKAQEAVAAAGAARKQAKGLHKEAERLAQEVHAAAATPGGASQVPMAPRQAAARARKSAERADSRARRLANRAAKAVAAVRQLARKEAAAGQSDARETTRYNRLEAREAVLKGRQELSGALEAAKKDVKNALDLERLARKNENRAADLLKEGYSEGSDKYHEATLAAQKARKEADTAKETAQATLKKAQEAAAAASGKFGRDRRTDLAQLERQLTRSEAGGAGARRVSAAAARTQRQSVSAAVAHAASLEKTAREAEKQAAESAALYHSDRTKVKDDRQAAKEARKAADDVKAQALEAAAGFKGAFGSVQRRKLARLNRPSGAHTISGKAVRAERRQLSGKLPDIGKSVSEARKLDKTARQVEKEAAQLEKAYSGTGVAILKGEEAKAARKAAEAAKIKAAEALQEAREAAGAVGGQFGSATNATLARMQRKLDEAGSVQLRDKEKETRTEIAQEGAKPDAPQPAAAPPDKKKDAEAGTAATLAAGAAAPDDPGLFMEATTGGGVGIHLDFNNNYAQESHRSAAQDQLLAEGPQTNKKPGDGDGDEDKKKKNEEEAGGDTGTAASPAGDESDKKHDDPSAPV